MQAQQPVRARVKNISGRRIKQARLTHRPTISQQGLAQKLLAKGIYSDQSIISRIGNQDRMVSDIELVAIARILKVRTGWLCGERRG